MTLFGLELTVPVLFSVLAILVSVVRYGTYLHSIYKKQTKPHLFSWVNWGLVTAIGAYAQFKLDGGPSAIVLAVVAFTCFFIAIVALFVGEKNITKSDWAAFIGALIAIPVWQATDNPIMALLVVIIIDILSYYPTFRKSWNDPWGEPPASYIWAGSRYFLTLFAVPNPSWETLLYPLFLMATDWGFAAYAFWRRHVLSKQKTMTAL